MRNVQRGVHIGGVFILVLYHILHMMCRHLQMRFFILFGEGPKGLNAHHMLCPTGIVISISKILSSYFCVTV